MDSKIAVHTQTLTHRRFKMFNQAIDAVQSGKKSIVNTFVSDKEIQSKLVTLIEAQTKFYQGWVDTTLTLAETLVSTAKTAVYKGAK